MPKRRRVSDALPPSQDVERHITPSPELDLEDEPPTEQCPVCHEEKPLGDLFVVCTNKHVLCGKCMLRIKKSETSNNCPVCRELMGLASRYEQRMLNSRHCLHAMIRARDDSREVLCPFSPYYRNGNTHDSYEFDGAGLERLRLVLEVDFDSVYTKLGIDLTKTTRIQTKNGKIELLAFVIKGTATPAELSVGDDALANVLYKVKGKPGAVPHSVKLVDGELTLVSADFKMFADFRGEDSVDDRILFLQALKDAFSFADASKNW